MIPARLHVHDRQHWDALTAGYPGTFRAALARDYDRVFDATPAVPGRPWPPARRTANGHLLDMCERIGPQSLRLSSSDEEICAFAERHARDCSKAAARAQAAGREPLPILVPMAEDAGVKAPEGRHMTDRGRVARLSDDRWWRRGVRSGHGRRVEAVAIGLGLVHKRAGLYASDEAVARRREQKSRNRRMLEEMQAVNELGDAFTLAELADKCVSNPVLRRGELMTRIAGFEAYADRVGDVGEFYTLTCPSRMHYNSGKWDGTTPREAQQYLCKLWGKVRAALGRRELRPYGFRVAEPHNDGCPHWHLLLFMPAAAVEQVRAIIRRYALAADGGEAGAAQHRFKAVAIDKKRGTAAGYIAKYVAKNIDGHALESDLYGRDPKDGAARVDAWAATWGIRQFQQQCGPPVTVWRELRRLREEQESELIEQAREAADKPADWGRYIEIMGGVDCPRDARPIRLEVAPAADRETGELRVNRYGEPAEGRIVGLRAGEFFADTRPHTWTVQRRSGGEGKSGGVFGEWASGDGCGLRYGAVGVPGQSAVSESGGEAGERGDDRGRADRVGGRRRDPRAGHGRGSLGSLSDGVAGAPWSPVNNCTGVGNGGCAVADPHSRAVEHHHGQSSAPGGGNDGRAAGMGGGLQGGRICRSTTGRPWRSAATCCECRGWSGMDELRRAVAALRAAPMVQKGAAADAALGELLRVIEQQDAALAGLLRVVERVVERHEARLDALEAWAARAPGQCFDEKWRGANG